MIGISSLVVTEDRIDMKYSCMKDRRILHGCYHCGGLIVSIKNRDGNTNVKFNWADTLECLFACLETRSRDVLLNLYADCGSYFEKIIHTMVAYGEHLIEVVSAVKDEVGSYHNREFLNHLLVIN